MLAALDAAAGVRHHVRGRPRRGRVSRARASARSARGLRLVQLRDKTWPLERRDAFARTLVAARASLRRARAAGTARSTRRGAAGCDGVHWTAATLAAASARPRDLIVAASCHTRDELARAARSSVDFAVLGPVPRRRRIRTRRRSAGTDSRAAVAGTRVPVYALGGLAPARPRRGDRPRRARRRAAARRLALAVAAPRRSSAASGGVLVVVRFDRRHAIAPRTPTRRGRVSCSAPSRTAATGTRSSTAPPCRTADT